MDGFVHGLYHRVIRKRDREFCAMSRWWTSTDNRASQSAAIAGVRTAALAIVLTGNPRGSTWSWSMQCISRGQGLDLSQVVAVLRQLADDTERQYSPGDGP